MVKKNKIIFAIISLILIISAFTINSFAETNFYFNGMTYSSVGNFNVELWADVYKNGAYSGAYSLVLNSDNGTGNGNYGKLATDVIDGAENGEIINFINSQRTAITPSNTDYDGTQEIQFGVSNIESTDGQNRVENIRVARIYSDFAIVQFDPAESEYNRGFITISNNTGDSQRYVTVAYQGSVISYVDNDYAYAKAYYITKTYYTESDSSGQARIYIPLYPDELKDFAIENGAYKENCGFAVVSHLLTFTTQLEMTPDYNDYAFELYFPYFIRNSTQEKNLIIKWIRNIANEVRGDTNVSLNDFNFLAWMGTILEGFFAIQIIPNLTIGIIFGGIVGILLFFAIMKLIKGGGE